VVRLLLLLRKSGSGKSQNTFAQGSDRDMRPDPPRLSRDGSGLAIGAGRKGRRGQLTKRRTCRLVRYPQMKEGPGGEAGAFKEETSQSRDQGALDAPILSHGTNQARRGSRKRPDPPGVGARRAGTYHNAVLLGAS
jgi:hypothetical protein